MEDKIKQGNLYEFYGDLLNDHQKKIYEDYVLNDLSLGEIAENEGITRQGVHDLVKRATNTLLEYENKLGMMKRFFSIREDISSMKSIISSGKYTDDQLLEILKRIDGEL
ncbi:MAG: DNA-binding protein [Lachnospiraceae bacterium]|nr:DNA-binding protein [Lachnospiraceae bacterium]